MSYAIRRTCTIWLPSSTNARYTFSTDYPLDEATDARDQVPSCKYHTKRSDKMKEHCQKMHGHRKGVETFAVVQRD